MKAGRNDPATLPAMPEEDDPHEGGESLSVLPPEGVPPPAGRDRSERDAKEEGGPCLTRTPPAQDAAGGIGLVPAKKRPRRTCVASGEIKVPQVISDPIIVLGAFIAIHCPVPRWASPVFSATSPT